MRFGRSRCIRLLILTALTAAGCQTASAPTAPPPIASPPSQQTSAAKPIFGSDPSAQRLQDLEGDILLYYAANRKLPDSLDDLRSVDSDVNFNSPVLGQPYIYDPRGLWAAGSNQSIILYDQVVTADGKRWCLFMSPPQGNGVLSLNVWAVPEKAFRLYRASGL
jgi:hypothetical protein